MLKTAKEYNTTFAALKLTEQLKIQLPAWYHLGTPPMRMTERPRCLQYNHNTRTVADLIHTAKRIDGPAQGRPHYNRRNCACDDCRQDAANGCADPNKCARKAKELLSHITPKLRPGTANQPDGLTHTHRRKTQNAHARKTKGAI
ncbi:hypothetical protein DENSPDRAFT_785348 [Dentipellis sp. KUC8613]|nr:hypothetical protein DENSPDRAFT_785348 [Dentipellis sp. KUC8613]